MRESGGGDAPNWPRSTRTTGSQRHWTQKSSAPISMITLLEVRQLDEARTQIRRADWQIMYSRLMETHAKPPDHPLYWVVKGQPRRNNFDAMFGFNRRETWITSSPPARWSVGDRLFFWRSSPCLDIVGVGELVRIPAKRVTRKAALFRVKYLGPRLNPLGIDDLRRDSIVRGAYFLKSGPAGTVFALTAAQGRRIYSLLRRRNPSLDATWPTNEDFDRDEHNIPDVDLLAASGFEGDRRLRMHLEIERRSDVAEKKKKAVLRVGRRLTCEVCDFDFRERYGQRGEGYCEVHHIRPLSTRRASTKTKLTDLAIVCSNCHRMLHRGKVLSVAQLQKQMTSLSPDSGHSRRRKS